MNFSVMCIDSGLTQRASGANPCAFYEAGDAPADGVVDVESDEEAHKNSCQLSAFSYQLKLSHRISRTA